jgi:hypothetical protein
MATVFDHRQVPQGEIKRGPSSGICSPEDFAMPGSGQRNVRCTLSFSRDATMKFVR